MGAIWYKPIELAATVSEVAGYKSGLSLTRDEIVEHVPSFGEYVYGPDDGLIRIRAEELEEMFADLLYALGNVSSPGITFVGDIIRRHRDDPELGPLGEPILELFLDMFPDMEKSSPADQPIDLTPFVLEARRRYGTPGASFALEFVREIEESIHKKPWPWVGYRRFAWDDTLELADLFESEGLQFLYGKFFDQRFIDYLYRNFDAVDDINWRKFEGLTCEFFERAGFEVEIGRGRGDEGIDARIWMPGKSKEAPPAILVQCKRQKDKVQKVVVKALWADIIAEGARSGIIVTTHSLSPGARRTSTARAYPIAEADRTTLREWIVVMRSPLAGVFMGE